MTNHGSNKPGAGGGGVVDVVLPAVLLVHWPVVVAVDHPVDPEHVCLVLLHHALGLQYKSRPAFQENSIKLDVANYLVEDGMLVMVRAILVLT